MILDKLICRAKSTDNKLTIIIGLVVSLQFIYDKVKDNPYSTFVKNQKIIVKAMDAEYDVNSEAMSNGIELYHSNKDEDENIKFSYIRHHGKLYESWYSRSKGCWVYHDSGTEKRLVELKHD